MGISRAASVCIALKPGRHTLAAQGILGEGLKKEHLEMQLLFNLLLIRCLELEVLGPRHQDQEEGRGGSFGLSMAGPSPFPHACMSP